MATQLPPVNLPPLPPACAHVWTWRAEHPGKYDAFLDNANEPYFTADQMHAYLLADRASRHAAEATTAEIPTYRLDMPKSSKELGAEHVKAHADRDDFGIGFTVNGWHVPARAVAMWRKDGWPAEVVAVEATKEVACQRCGDTGVVDDGMLTHSEGGAEYSEPIRCVKDCPACSPAAPVAVARFPFAGFDPKFCPGSNPENPQDEEPIEIAPVVVAESEAQADDLLTVAHVTTDGGGILTMLAPSLGDLIDIVGDEPETYSVSIATMRRAEFEAMGEFDGF